jgi:hypothetical protein
MSSKHGTRMEIRLKLWYSVVNKYGYFVLKDDNMLRSYNIRGKYNYHDGVGDRESHV